jgi:hypothetical protein
MESWDIDSKGKRIRTPEEQRQQVRRWLIGAVVGVFVLLLLRVLLLSVVAPTPALAPPAPSPTPAPALGAPAPTALPARPAVAPPATATTAAASPAQPTAGDACPDAIAPGPEVRVGWLARVAGCPHIALGNIDGTRQWVLRDRLSDAIYAQLPEVSP